MKSKNELKPATATAKQRSRIAWIMQHTPALYLKGERQLKMLETGKSGLKRTWGLLSLSLYLLFYFFFFFFFFYYFSLSLSLFYLSLLTPPTFWVVFYSSTSSTTSSSSEKERPAREGRHTKICQRGEIHGPEEDGRGRPTGHRPSTNTHIHTHTHTTIYIHTNRYVYMQ